VYVCRADKEKQQISIEIDGLMTQLDSSNKAKVTCHEAGQRICKRWQVNTK